MVTQAINVNYEGELVGAVSFNTDTGIGAFEYDPGFINKGIELSPTKMPLSRQIARRHHAIAAPSIHWETRRGRTGVLASDATEKPKRFRES